MTNIKHFKASLLDAYPPDHLKDYLLALWYDGKGNWDKAHDIVQDLSSLQAAWIHAYLHRKEGDKWNANYWYQRAGKIMPEIPLEIEWEQMVAHFLTD